MKKTLSRVEILSREQFFYVWQFLSNKERIVVLGLLSVIIISGATWITVYRFQNTESGPDFGGMYHEAILGQVQYINPILAQTNDADRDLSVLLFSGLMKYSAGGGLENDIAEKYDISEDGKTYTFYLRKDVKWHDGTELTADDVIFTINSIQDIDYRSPVRINWQGVKVEKIDDFTVEFILNNVYAPFLENTTIGIIPKHIWQDISPQNFPLAELNLKPIGSGPYKFKKLQKDKLGNIKDIELTFFEDYHLGRAHIKTIKFSFYKSPEIMIQAYNNNLVQGLNFLAIQDKDQIKSNLNIYSLKLPRYFAVFFNQNQSKALSDKVVRVALNHATNKQKIVNEILGGNAEVVDSPILPNLLGYTPNTKIYDFAPEHAANILEEAGWKDLDGDGFREKESKGSNKKIEVEPLEIAIITTNWPEFVDVAESLKRDWEQVGIKTAIGVSDVNGVQHEYIRPRKYQAFLFGQVLSYIPDPFSFWHSSQKKDPGLNLALYDNDEVDKLLQDARQTLDDEVRAQKYEEFQKLLIDDAPVVFLYSPHYLYAVSKRVKGIEIENVVTPSQRFSDVNKWYIETRRVKK